MRGNKEILNQNFIMNLIDSKEGIVINGREVKIALPEFILKNKNIHLNLVKTLYQKGAKNIKEYEDCTAGKIYLTYNC